MATLGEEDAPFDAPPSCANNPNASAMGAAEWAACAGSSGEAYAPFVTIIEAQARRWQEGGMSFGQQAVLGSSSCLRLPSAQGSLGKPTALAVLACQCRACFWHAERPRDRAGAGCVATYVPGPPPYCTYGRLRVPASCALHGAEARGSLPRARCAVATRTGLGLAARTARGKPWLCCHVRPRPVRVATARHGTPDTGRGKLPPATARGVPCRGTAGAREEQRRRVRPGLWRRAVPAARRRPHGLPLHRLRGAFFCQHLSLTCHPHTMYVPCLHAVVR